MKRWIASRLVDIAGALFTGAAGGLAALFIHERWRVPEYVAVSAAVCAVMASLVVAFHREEP